MAKLRFEPLTHFTYEHVSYKNMLGVKKITAPYHEYYGDVRIVDSKSSGKKYIILQTTLRIFNKTVISL
jgi:hypothetical protein